jgi:hypothetical protein
MFRIVDLIPREAADFGLCGAPHFPYHCQSLVCSGHRCEFIWIDIFLAAVSANLQLLPNSRCEELIIIGRIACQPKEALLSLLLRARPKMGIQGREVALTNKSLI